MSKYNDKLLHNYFQLLKNGNVEIIGTIYTQYSDSIIAIAFSILKNKDKSQDVMQEVFVKLHTTPLDKLPESNEFSWLYTVTKNKSLDFLRKFKGTTNIDDFYSIQNENDEICDLIEKESYNNLISILSKRSQEIVSLKILSNFSFKEIGKFLNLPTSTVSWIYYKSVNKLKLYLSNIIVIFITLGVYIVNKGNITKGYNNLILNKVIEKSSLLIFFISFIIFTKNLIKCRKKITDKSSK